MTPLRQLLGSIWALIPGQILDLFIAWVGAALIALVSLAIDENRGERPKRPILATTLFGLRSGAMFTIRIIVSAARSEGLLSGNHAIAAIAALLSSVPSASRHEPEVTIARHDRDSSLRLAPSH